MKFKYYLKGIGMGIIVTTIVLSVSFAMHDEDLSDEEIIERAKEIGMIMPESESGGLFGSQEESDTENEEESESDRMTQEETQSETESESQSEPETQIETESQSEPETQIETESQSEPETQIETESQSESESQVPSESESQSESESPSETESSSETETPTTQVEITQYILHVVWGSTPRTIGEELLEAGMIEDVSDFRAYLKEHGYAGKIKTGDYTITKGMTYEEIAKIITKSE